MIEASDRRASFDLTQDKLRSRPTTTSNFEVWFLPGDVEIGWKRRARVCNAARWMCRIVCADFSWWRLNWLFGSSCFEVRRA